MQYDRSKTDWVDHPEQVWAIVRAGDGDAIREVHSTKAGAEIAEQRDGFPWGVEIKEITLHRPSLRAVYGGPTLIEALWNEMDDIMERLMTGQEQEDVCGRKDCPTHVSEWIDGPEDETCKHIDNGDRYRAQELAWVLAIVTNAYDPSVDRIRAEAMERWNRAQEEPAGGSTLNREEQGR